MTALRAKGFRFSVYENKLLFLTLLITMLMSPVFYFLFNNYAPANFTLGVGGKSGTYILRSVSTVSRLKETGGNPAAYDTQIEAAKTFLSDQGYDPKVIGEGELSTLVNTDTLFVIDAIALEDSAVESIKRFVDEGGALVFNHYSAFSRPDGSWRGDEMVRSLSGLSTDPYIHTLAKQSGIFATPKVFSPLTTRIPNGPRLNVVFYDNIPLFRTPQTLKPDVVYTDWTQYDAPRIDGVHLPKEFAGAMWHGFYGKGSWVYFTFPFYVFSSSGDAPLFKNLFEGIVRYSAEGGAVRVHPYLNGKNPVFVSEDTEFRFENARAFSDAVRELQVPSTAFCVSMLAERHKEVSAELGKNPYIEIGSHSHTHGDLLGGGEEGLAMETAGSKKRLSSLVQADVTGFRPPREEIDDAVAKKLVETGYEYTMEKNKGHLYPSIIRKNLVVISRVGTDDFGFMTHYTFNEAEIVEKARREASFINDLDGIYTLSVHTHLFSDPQNIGVVRSILEQLRGNGEFRQGRDIARRVKAVSLIRAELAISHENYIVSVINSNPYTVPEAVVRLYWPKRGKVTSLKTDTTGVKFAYTHNDAERYTDITLYDLTPKKQFALMASYRQ